MKELHLKASLREEFGRRPSSRLRKSGEIPAVIYGPSGNRTFKVSESELRAIMRQVGGGSSIVKIDLGKESILSAIKVIDRDARTDAFLHVDFQEVSERDEANFTIAVHTQGESIGVKNENGLIDVLAHELNIRCLPGSLPSSIDVDISELHVGGSIHVKDLPAIKGVTFSDDPETTVVACVAQRTAAAEDEDEAEASEVAPGGEEAAASESEAKNEDA